jgi:hypothetical protein
MFIVTLNHLGNTFYLRSTVWSFALDRATRYHTEDAARDALNKARKFMKAAQYRAAKIEPILL